jgi:Family of unknown function (DUF6551)
MTLARQFKTKLIEMEVGKLKLHSAANRDLKQSRVRRLVAEMDLDSLGVFAVWRDGRDFYVIDGQHRKIALEELGLADWSVPCLVFEGMEFADACERFLKLNDGLTVNPWEKFDKGVKSGREACVESKKIVEAAGFRVSSTYGDGKVVCVRAIEDGYKLDRGQALVDTFELLPAMWGHTAAAVEGQIVRGFCLLAHRLNGQLDRDSLVRKMSKYPGGPTRLIGTAKARQDIHGGTIAFNLAQAVVDVYNKGRRSEKVVL